MLIDPLNQTTHKINSLMKPTQELIMPYINSLKVSQKKQRLKIRNLH